MAEGPEYTSASSSCGSHSQELFANSLQYASAVLSSLLTLCPKLARFQDIWVVGRLHAARVCAETADVE